MCCRGSGRSGSFTAGAILATLPSGLQEISDLFDEALAATYGLFSSDLPAALAALAAAMAAPVVDWSTVACNLFWATSTLLADENALRDTLVYLALAYPAPVLLGGTDVNGNTQPATDLSPDPNLQQAPSQPAGNVAPTQGVPLTRSNSLRPGQDPDLCPAAMDTSVQNLADLDWLIYPFPPVSPSAGAPTTSWSPPDSTRGPRRS